MERKRSEKSLGKMMRRYGYNVQKGRDSGYFYCPSCREPVITCPHCKANMRMQKATRRLDFIVMMDWIEVECKQGDETWALNDFTEIQEALLPEPIEHTGEPRWLFLEIGDGRAPNGKEAYLIPADEFLRIREAEYKNGKKSIRFRSTERSKVSEAQELFSRWTLVWETGEGWGIPEGHEFWTTREKLDTILENAIITKTEDTDEQSGQPTSTPARLDVLG